MATSLRSAISLTHKRALRQHAHQNNALSNKQLQAWFQDTYGQAIAPSSVSEILSSRYSYLDQNEIPLSQKKKNRRENWPELEEQLVSWAIHVVSQNDDKPGDGPGLSERISAMPGRVIREEARTLWNNIPTYTGDQVPSFSNCWILRFKSRCQDKLRVVPEQTNANLSSTELLQDESLPYQTCNGDSGHDWNELCFIYDAGFCSASEN